MIRIKFSSQVQIAAVIAWRYTFSHGLYPSAVDLIRADREYFADCRRLSLHSWMEPRHRRMERDDFSNVFNAAPGVAAATLRDDLARFFGASTVGAVE